MGFALFDLGGVGGLGIGAGWCGGGEMGRLAMLTTSWIKVPIDPGGKSGGGDIRGEKGEGGVKWDFEPRPRRLGEKAPHRHRWEEGWGRGREEGGHEAMPPTCSLIYFAILHVGRWSGFIGLWIPAHRTRTK